MEEGGGLLPVFLSCSPDSDTYFLIFDGISGTSVLNFVRASLGVIGFYRVLLGCTGFYRVLPGFTRFYRVLPGFTGLSVFFFTKIHQATSIPWFYRALLGFTGFTGFYWVSLGSIGFFFRNPLSDIYSLVLPGFYWVLPGFTRFLPGFIGLHRVLPGFVGFFFT